MREVQDHRMSFTSEHALTVRGIDMHRPADPLCFVRDSELPSEQAESMPPGYTSVGSLTSGSSPAMDVSPNASKRFLCAGLHRLSCKLQRTGGASSTPFPIKVGTTTCHSKCRDGMLRGTSLAVHIASIGSLHALFDGISNLCRGKTGGGFSRQ